MNKIIMYFFVSWVGTIVASQDTQAKYVNIDTIHPGQIRFSKANVDQKVKNALKKGYATRIGNPTFNENTSILKPEAALPVVIIPTAIAQDLGKEYVLVDGHHDVKSSLALGATTVPVYIKEDLKDSTKNEKEFWAYLEGQGYTYPYNLDAQKSQIPKEFHSLQDDINRYFAAISARKYPSFDSKPEDSTYTSPIFYPEYPLWIKVDKDVPFIEFMISDKLNNYNKKNPNDQFVFSYEMENDPVKMQKLIEKAREILNKNYIKGLKLIKIKKHFKDIKLKNYTNKK